MSFARIATNGDGGLSVCWLSTNGARCGGSGNGPLSAQCRDSEFLRADQRRSKQAGREKAVWHGPRQDLNQQRREAKRSLAPAR
jgi:hypothetical protein